MVAYSSSVFSYLATIPSHGAVDQSVNPLKIGFPCRKQYIYRVEAQLLVRLLPGTAPFQAVECASERLQPRTRNSWGRNDGSHRAVCPPMKTSACHILPRERIILAVVTHTRCTNSHASSHACNYKGATRTPQDVCLPRPSHDVYTSSHACKRTGRSSDDINSAIVLSVVTSHSTLIMKLPCFLMWTSVGGL